MKFLIDCVRTFPDITMLVVSLTTGIAIAIIAKLWLSLHDISAAFKLSDAPLTRYHSGTAKIFTDAQHGTPANSSSYLHDNAETQDLQAPLIISRFDIHRLCQELADLFRNSALHPAIRVVSTEASLFVWADRDKIDLMIFSYLFSRLTTCAEMLKDITIHISATSIKGNRSVLELTMECTPETNRVLLPSSNHILTFQLMKWFTALQGGGVRITVDSTGEKIRLIIPNVDHADTFAKAFHQN